MAQQRPERRSQSDEAQGLAKPPAETPTDIGREDELRASAKKKLLDMAGLTAEQAESEPHTVAVAEAGASTPELSPEQQAWLDQFKTRFDALSQLHQGVRWADVEKSLRADPEAMRKLQALNDKGYEINISPEIDGNFVFVPGRNDHNGVSKDHRDVGSDTSAPIYPGGTLYTVTSGAHGDIGELGGLSIHPQKRRGDGRGPFCSEIVIVRKV